MNPDYEQALLARIADLTEALRSRAHHLVVEEDAFYSCELLTPEWAAPTGRPRKCNCGAQVAIDALAREEQRKKETP